MRAPTQLSEATTCSQERGSRGKTLSSWMKVGEIWVWRPVRVEIGLGTSGVEI